MALVITSPAAGETVLGTVNLIGTDGGVTVQAMNGAVSLGSTVLVQPMSFSVPVDTTQLANGPQTLTVNDGVNVATVSVIVNNVVALPASTLTISSPAAGAAEGATFNVVGVAGSQWVNIAVFDHANMTKVGADTTPAADGTFSIPINMGTLSGTRQLDVTAFSDPAGVPGGTSMTASVSVVVSAPVVVVTPPVSTSALPFYGAGSHYVDGGVYQSIPFATKIAHVQAAGCSGVREDAYSLSDLTTHVNTLVSGWAPLKVLSCFIPTISGSASAAYNTYYTLGQQAAAIVAGHIPALEFGNEWDLICISNNNGTDGNVPNQYNQTTTAMYMAAMAGFTQGFRNVDTTSQTLLGVNGTYLHFGWLNMIVNNTLPNGAASGHLPIVNDFLTWHHYSTGGNPAQVNGHSATYNVLNSIEALTNKPYYFSETGGGAPNVSNSTCQAWIGTAYALFAAHPKCMGGNWYELYDYTDGAYGLYSISGNTATAKPQVATMKAFTVANPK